MTMRCAARCVAAGALLFSAGCASAPDTTTAEEAAFTSQARRELCPSRAHAVPFDLSDPLESQLSAIGCHDKTLVSGPQAGPQRFIAFCSDDAANDALVAQYRHVQPYRLRTVSTCDELPDGTVVDEWDPCPGPCSRRPE